MNVCPQTTTAIVAPMVPASAATQAVSSGAASSGKSGIAGIPLWCWALGIAAFVYFDRKG